jgi:hypothetical protein
MGVQSRVNKREKKKERERITRERITERGKEKLSGDVMKGKTHTKKWEKIEKERERKFERWRDEILT